MRKVNPGKSEARRTEILDAAIRGFARSGLRGVSLSDLREDAGIRPGHLAHDFDGKEAIIEAMVETGPAQAAAEFARLEAAADPPTPLKFELQRFVKNAAGGEPAISLEILAEAAQACDGKNRKAAYRTDEGTPGRTTSMGAERRARRPASGRQHVNQPV